MAAPPSGNAALAQLVEHIIRNDGVVGSSPSSGTSLRQSFGRQAGLWATEGRSAGGDAEPTDHPLTLIQPRREKGSGDGAAVSEPIDQQAQGRAHRW